MEIEPGTVIDRYTVDSPLGEGGMAVVYKVRHNQLGTWHALKILTLSSRSIRERLLQEGRVQAALRHTNIVAVTDVIEINGAPGLVMEYIGGPSLEELLSSSTLTMAQAEALACGVISGVKAAHDRGLIHRDLKPANVLLDVTDSGLTPKVTDFGLSKIVTGDSGMSKTRSGVAMGTPSYMSPEQIRSSKDVDHRTDIFALGAILYDLYCGQQCFPGDDLLAIFSKVTAGEFPRPSELVPDLPPRVEQAILGALAVDMNERTPDCAALLAALTGRGAHDVAASVTADLATSGPWSGEFLSSTRSLGTSSNESFEDIITGRAAKAAAAQAQTQTSSQETFTLERTEEKAASHSGSITSVPPSTGSLPGLSAGSSSRSMAGAAIVAFGLLLGVVGVGGIGALYASGAFDPATAPEAGTATEAEPAPPAAPEPPAPTEVAPKPAPVEADAATDDVAEADGATPAPTPAPAAAPPTPAPAEAPAPVVVSVPAPAPKPVVTVKPKPPPAPTMAAGHGKVVISGDTEGIRLVDGRMKAYFPGEVPAGTYSIMLKTDAGFQPLGTVKVDEGNTVKLACNSAMMSCR